MGLFFISFFQKTTMSYRGKLLTADPSVLGDPYFHRSVVLIVDQTKEGYVGFILNKPLAYTLDDVMDSVGINAPLYFGGPIENENLFFIHNLGAQIKGSVAINQNLFWGGDFEKLIQKISQHDNASFFVRFFLGYAGWETDQLQAELDNGSWMVGKATEDVITETPEALWRNQLVRQGGNYLLWANTPENPFNN